MLYALQGHPRYETADMSSMETIFYGASPMSPAKLAQAIEDWGPIFFQFFGQTEAPMVITHLKKGEHDLARPDRLASCGRPVPWMHVALLDSNNRPVAPGASGEICTRGPLVMTGYKDLPDETAEALSGDWLHTGDVGRFDDDGYLYIVDRTKDMVITGGFNVFPREVEDVISTHPAVSMVMVIGVPDDKWGEAVKAVVVLRPDHEPSDALTRRAATVGEGREGFATVTEVDRLRRRAAADPRRQARQEGGAGSVLERRRSSGLVGPTTTPIHWMFAARCTNSSAFRAGSTIRSSADRSDVSLRRVGDRREGNDERGHQVRAVGAGRRRPVRLRVPGPDRDLPRHRRLELLTRRDGDRRRVHAVGTAEPSTAGRSCSRRSSASPGRPSSARSPIG